MHKHFCASRVVVSELLGKDLFHGAYFTYYVYKVEVCAMMMSDAPLPFANYKDEPAQLYLK
jgi:hypothetical protein